MKRVHPPPLFPLFYGRSFDGHIWSNLAIKSECKQKVPEHSLAATRICGFTVDLNSPSSSSTTSPVQQPPEKE
jgi:hypothetical protein